MKNIVPVPLKRLFYDHNFLTLLGRNLPHSLALESIKVLALVTLTVLSRDGCFPDVGGEVANVTM